jgi:hypothetical protein
VGATGDRSFLTSCRGIRCSGRSWHKSLILRQILFPASIRPCSVLSRRRCGDARSRVVGSQGHWSLMLNPSVSSDAHLGLGNTPSLEEAFLPLNPKSSRTCRRVKPSCRICAKCGAAAEQRSHITSKSMTPASSLKSRWHRLAGRRHQGQAGNSRLGTRWTPSGRVAGVISSARHASQLASLFRFQRHCHAKRCRHTF